jgi:translation initiation factor 1
MDICPNCGLPLQACACKDISKTNQEIKVALEKRRFGKFITVVSGFKDVDVKEVAKSLKSELACGGTFKNNTVELQGNHRGKIKPILIEIGFEESQIKDQTK